MKIDPRFDRACKAEDLRKKRQLERAAPDLLEACKDALVYIDNPTQSPYMPTGITHLLRLAIERAEK